MGEVPAVNASIDSNHIDLNFISAQLSPRSLTLPYKLRKILRSLNLKFRIYSRSFCQLWRNDFCHFG